MDRTTAGPGPSFTQPVRQIVLMLSIVALVAAGGWLALPRVEEVFLANIWLNGFIGGVFLFGIGACFWQVISLMQSVRWIEGFVGGRGDAGQEAAPRLLAPLASLLRSRGAGRMQISPTSQRSILESVAQRIDEARDITRYLVNLLIFLGLLGTFYGLATTVPAVVETIRSLAPQEGETGMQVFDKLMGGLEAQLGGMGTAFSSSLLGLAGSLVVGLLELFAGHGQNRFYRELEEWTSTITRIGLAGGDGAGEGDGGALAGVMADFADRMGAQMEGLQALHARSDAGRALLEERIGTVAEAMLRLAQRMEAEARAREAAQGAQAEALSRLADGQAAMAEALAAPEGGAHVDAESRMRLRSIDVQLLRILEEISAGRQESIADLRADLGALTTAIRQLSRGAPTPPPSPPPLSRG